MSLTVRASVVILQLFNLFVEFTQPFKFWLK